MAEKEQIRITLKPKGAKIKISLPEEPAEKQQEVMPPSPRDVPKEPAEKIRISLRHDPAPAEPPPMAKIVREEQPPMPRQEKKTEEQLREDAAEAEALLKIRQLEAMAQAEAGNGLERYGLTKRKIIFILFLIGIFVTIFLYAASMEKGAKAIAEAKNPKGRFGKILPQNNELFNELINDEEQRSSAGTTGKNRSGKSSGDTGTAGRNGIQKVAGTGKKESAGNRDCRSTPQFSE